MDVSVTLTVNGAAQTITTDARRSLLDVLREDLGLTGAKYGCGEGHCRSCVVLVDGRPAATCAFPIEKANGKTITTIEGLSQGDALHPVQQAFLDEEAFQCGYCTPGMILTAAALLEHNPRPTEQEVVTWMNGNLCRCCGYPRIVQAILRAAKNLAEAPAV